MGIKLSIKWSYKFAWLVNAPTQWVIQERGSIWLKHSEIWNPESCIYSMINCLVIYPLVYVIGEKLSYFDLKFNFLDALINFAH